MKFTERPQTSTTGSGTTASGAGPVCYDCVNHVATDGTCQNLTQCLSGEVRINITGIAAQNVYSVFFTYLCPIYSFTHLSYSITFHTIIKYYHYNHSWGNPYAPHFWSLWSILKFSLGGMRNSQPTFERFTSL